MKRKSEKMIHLSRREREEESCCELRNNLGAAAWKHKTQNLSRRRSHLSRVVGVARRRSSECVRLPAGADNWLERAHQRPREPLSGSRQSRLFARSRGARGRTRGQTNTLSEPGTARYAHNNHHPPTCSSQFLRPPRALVVRCCCLLSLRKKGLFGLSSGARTPVPEYRSALAIYTAHLFLFSLSPSLFWFAPNDHNADSQEWC